MRTPRPDPRNDSFDLALAIELASFIAKGSVNLYVSQGQKFYDRIEPGTVALTCKCEGWLANDR